MSSTLDILYDRARAVSIRGPSDGPARSATVWTDDGYTVLVRKTGNDGGPRSHRKKGTPVDSTDFDEYEP